MKTKILYMCHPVAGGKHHTAKAWLQAINKVLVPKGAVAVAPWLPQVELGESEGAARKFWLWVDVDLVTRMDGVIVAGKELTEGMMMEVAAAKAAGLPVLHANVALDTFQRMAAEGSVGIDMPAAWLFN